MSNGGEDESSSTSPPTAISRSAERESASEVPPGNVRKDHVMKDFRHADPPVLREKEKESDSTESDNEPEEITPASPTTRLKHSFRGVFSSPTVARSEVLEPPMNIRDTKNLAQLNDLVKSSSPEALQALLKANWRAFLFEGSSSGIRTAQNVAHLSFILRAGFKNSPTVVLDKVLKSPPFSRPKIVEILSQNRAIVDKVLNEATYIQLLLQVPEEVLEQALIERLKFMPANKLVTMLAKANRLGYKHDDIVDPRDESVMPHIPTPAQEDAEMTDEDITPAPSFHHALALPDTDPLLAEQERNAAALQLMLPILKAARTSKAPAPAPAPAPQQIGGGPLNGSVLSDSQGRFCCGSCLRWLPNYAAYTYHLKKKICQKEPPPGGFKWSCKNCFLGFTGKAALAYHEINNVCQPEENARATTPSHQLQLEAAARSSQALPSMVNPQSPSQGPLPAHAPAPRPAAEVRIPLHTPVNQITQQGSSPITKAPDSETRLYHSPSELAPEKLSQMNRQLADQQAKYDAQRTAVATDPKYPSQEEKRARLVSLKASDATRRSQIRKSFGVTLRMRDRDKQALAASKSQPVHSSLAGFRRPSGSAAAPATNSPLSAGSFSPVNAPRNGYKPSAPSNFGVLVPEKGPYGHKTPYSQPGPSMHNSPHFTGSGVQNRNMHYQQPPPRQYSQFDPPNQSANQQHPNKRQRTSGEGTYSPNPGQNNPYPAPVPVRNHHAHPPPSNQPPHPQSYSQPRYPPYQNRPATSATQSRGMAMVEVSSEDAATSLRKARAKTAARSSNTDWLKPSFQTPPVPARQHLGASAAGGGKVIVLSSSEDEDDGDGDGIRPSAAVGAGRGSFRVEISVPQRAVVRGNNADRPLRSVEGVVEGARTL